MKKKTVTALVPNILGWAPGQQVRIENWEKYLNQAGWTVEYFTFENNALHEVLYQQGNNLKKVRRILSCYNNLLNTVLTKSLGDVILVYREAALIGPAWIESLIAKKKPVIFDIDDPIFLPYKSPVNGWASLLKFSRKTNKIFSLSSEIIAVNSLIGNYAKNYNPNVTVIPNCVDIEKYKPTKSDKTSDNPDSARLIWIGSHSTMPNLLEISEPLRKLQAEYRCPFIVIGAGDIQMDGVEIDMRQWSAETEVDNLQEGDIGLVPLIDTDWNRWKYAFKIIQYMAIGIPVVAPRIGSNSEVIKDGVNGFIVDSKQDWFKRLEILIKNPDLRREMGVNARKTVEENFSANIQMPRMIEVFEKTYIKSVQQN